MEQQIRCLVVDDEPFARELMTTYIGRVPQLELVATCENALEALEILQNQTIDLLFSDIRMPNINGVEMIRSLPHIPLVIFTTASRDYAVEGYELDVVDYLMKPFGFDRLLKAINKAKAILQQRKQPAAPEKEKLSPATYMFVKDGQKLSKVIFNDIYYVEGMKDYIKIVTARETHIIYQRMKHMEDLLPDNQFIRVHKSYIVQLNAIKNIIGNTAELINNHTIIISKQYKSELNKRLGITSDAREGEE
ncbi:two component transcriptional regulator, LytTR family [Chitinophaga jiangningensis]|uniref:Two component transcriptional regulator, LytTR family n=1 Tax=Chitinophaga jiangningensis TaxID=1419482 RepID=A0A1M7FIU0_9BACT|nr:LytTR family DNA-binding domain-containing protein [Chitinophaga jiangningensis]SHM03547.1 two component transcriptional regulator, LytTR family [Chitinophaga jiangningensis]